MAPCKSCHRRMRTLQKQRVTHKPVEEIKSMAFGEHTSPGTRGTWNYRLSFIRIGTEPYCGIIKCNNSRDTRVRCFMPLASWNSMLTDVLPKFTDTPFSRQLAIDERYKSTHFPFHIMISFHYFHFPYQYFCNGSY